MIISMLGNPVWGTAPAATTLLAIRSSAAGSQTGGPMLVWLGIALGAITALCAGLYFAHRGWHRHRHHSHAALFTSLCQAHGLGRDSRRLLAQVRRHYRLAQPARLFTEPQWLDPSNLGGPLQARAEELSALRTRLFSIGAPKSVTG
jgi:hypothetical protein